MAATTNPISSVLSVDDLVQLAMRRCGRVYNVEHLSEAVVLLQAAIARLTVAQAPPAPAP